MRNKQTDKSPATAGAKAWAANDVSLREMMNDARLRRMMRCLRQHLGRKSFRFSIFIGIKQTDKSEFEGFKQVLLQPTLEAVKTMALPLGELARSD